MSNPTEALQDAQASYAAGDYEKTISLIKIYASLSGKRDAQNLLSNAQKCQQFVEKAIIYKEQGDDSSVIECYRSILAINPKDKNAKSKVSVSYDEIGNYHSLGIALVRKGNKWGAVDKEKNIVVPIVYDKIDPAWCEGFGYFGPKQTTCIAEREGKTVFVNMNGREVTPDNLYYAIRGIATETPNMYYMVYKYNSPEVYVDMNGVEYPTEEEAAIGRITKNDQINPTRRPSHTIISKSESIYCDGVYHGPYWEYDYKTTALYESLGRQFNRNYFSISFDYYIQKSDNGYDYEYAPNTNIITLDTGSRAFGLKPWKNTIYAATNNYDNYFDTAIRFEFETWQRIDLVYDNGKLYINGRVLDIGPLTQSTENVLTSVNFASGLCFKGYIKNLIVKSE